MSLSKKAVTTYAKSLFQNAKSGSSLTSTFDLTNVSIPMSADQAKNFVPDVNIIGEELLLLSSTVSSSTRLKTFFNNPTYPESQKFDVLLTIFPGLTVMTKSFLKVLTERSHLKLLPEIHQAYVRLLNGFNGACEVKIVTASTLKETYGKTLLTALKKLTAATNIMLNVSYNPRLLGGLILEYGSSSIDASILKEFSLFFNEN